MAISYVGQVGENYVNPASSTLTITTTDAAGVGSFLILSASVGAAARPTGITDTGGNIWSLVATSPLVARTTSTWVCTITTALAVSSTITVTYSANTFNRLASVYSFTGINRPIITSATAQATGVTTLNTGNLVPSQYASLLFTAVSVNASETFTTPSGWTRLPLTTSSVFDALAYKIQPSVAAQGTTWAWIGSRSAGQVSTSFTPDGGDFLALF